MSKEKYDTNAWKGLFVPEQVLKALAEDKFFSPTLIQTLTLPSAIRDHKDIIGAAETGSGKTLAFGIPLIHSILEFKNKCKTDNQTKDNSNDASASDDEITENYSNINDKQLLRKSEDTINKDINTDSNDSHSDVTDCLNNANKSGSQLLSANILDLGMGYAVDFGGEKNDNSSDDDINISPGSEDEQHFAADEKMGCVRVLNDVAFDQLVEQKEKSRTNLTIKFGKTTPLLALVLTPTRELAVQVKQHIDRAARYTDIKTCVVVGGMSVQKQRRVLKRQPDIIVATPGRLWELIQEGITHLSNIADIKYLVIDEADRMIEKGHFQELTQLLELLNEDEKKKNRRQTFVFSATLTLVHSGPNRLIRTKKKKFKTVTRENKLDTLMTKVGIKPKAKIIDLSRKEGTAQSLVESRITSSQEEKDLYLYYFLLTYPGRTLVFANSKDALRRLASVLALLECRPLLLHADMRQKQRLKNLDRFKSDARGLLLATDVAARGLDIPAVQHVIHFQVPRTSENYVHRSGRTARATNEGLSVMLVSADDLVSYRKIIKTLNRDEELPIFPVDDGYLPTIRARVNLSRQIDKMQHATDKQHHQNSWFEKAAKEADLELDTDGIYSVISDTVDKRKQIAQTRKLESMKMQLKQMLITPIMHSNFSGKYPTKSGHIVVPYMKGQSQSASAADTLKESIKAPLKRKLASQQQPNKLSKRRKRNKKH